MHLADVHVKRRVVTGRPGPPINLPLSPEASCRHARTAGRRSTGVASIASCRTKINVAAAASDHTERRRARWSRARGPERDAYGGTIWANVCSADCSGCSVRSAHSRGMQGKATGGAHEPAIWTTGVGDDGPAPDAELRTMHAPCGVATVPLT
jgi:hypothetical protein